VKNIYVRMENFLSCILELNTWNGPNGVIRIVELHEKIHIKHDYRTSAVVVGSKYNIFYMLLARLHR
jgi:hypothetical protein